MVTTKDSLHKADNVQSVTQDRHEVSHYEVRPVGLEHTTTPEWKLELQLSLSGRVGAKTCLSWGLLSTVLFPLSHAQVSAFIPALFLPVSGLGIQSHLRNALSM